MRCWNGCAFFHIWSSIQSYCLSKQSIDTCFSPKSSFSHRVAPSSPAAGGKKITVLQGLVTTYLLHADVVEPEDKKIMFFKLVNFSTLWLSYWHLASADFLTLLPFAWGTSQFLSCRGFIAVSWLPNKPILCALLSGEPRDGVLRNESFDDSFLLWLSPVALDKRYHYQKTWGG